MKYILILIVLLNSTLSYGQKFDRVKTVTIDSFDRIEQEFLTNIKFELNKEDKLLIINEGNDNVKIKFDIIYEKRNGIYLITIGNPDYFIINPNWVIHHREYITDVGMIIIRNKYTTDLKQL